MANFQLKMAMQLGEKMAAEFGFTDFPIDPFKIAAAKKIGVEAKPPSMTGVSGAMIFASGEATLIYSSEYTSGI